MPHLIDLREQRFGKWTVIGRHVRFRRKTYWPCGCDCGHVGLIWAPSLTSGDSTNCGCVRRKKLVARNGTHGLTSHPLYQRWSGMIARCEDPNNSGYPNYGGRGIRVCESWRKSFKAFLDNMGEPPTPKHTLDRIDNDGDYEPNNCRWVTGKQNSRNTRKNRLIEFRGETLALVEWGERLGIAPKTLHARIMVFGWGIEKAFTTPVAPWNRASEAGSQRGHKPSPARRKNQGTPPPETLAPG